MFKHLVLRGSMFANTLDNFDIFCMSVNRDVNSL